jgi:hypothetical protein
MTRQKFEFSGFKWAKDVTNLVKPCLKPPNLRKFLKKNSKMQSITNSKQRLKYKENNQ